MKFLDKLGLALFSLLILIISIVLCLIGFGWMEPSIFSILLGKILISQQLTYVLIGVSIFLILLAIKCIFFSGVDQELKEKEKDVGILLQNEDGKLLITVETLKNIVEGVIKDFDEIISSESAVMITKENEIVIDVSINVAHTTIIKNISSMLQMKIKKDIKDTTGLEIEAVNVRVKNVENLKQKENIKADEPKKEIPKKVASNKKNVNEVEKKTSKNAK